MFSFLIERIMSLNCFGCGLSSREYHIHTMKQAESQLEPTKNETFHSCGVWPLASYINHSCNSNARRSFIGDMMIVRATRDLPKDTELVFWYKAPLDNTSKAKPLNLKHWGFRCSCAICQDSIETEDSDLMKRRRLTADVANAFQSLGKSRKPNLVIARIEELVSKLEGTYRKPAIEVPRAGIWKAYSTLAGFHASRGISEKAVEFALKAFESLGYVLEGGRLPRRSGARLHVLKWGLMTDGLVGCWIILCRAYCDVAPELADQAEDYARTTYRMCIGEDETFGDTYSRFSKRADGFLVRAE